MPVEYITPLEVIKSWYQRFLQSYVCEYIPEAELKKMEQHAKKTWPGNYYLIQKYNHVTKEYEVDIAFDDEYEELIWWLKYG